MFEEVKCMLQWQLVTYRQRVDLQKVIHGNPVAEDGILVFDKNSVKTQVGY